MSDLSSLPVQDLQEKVQDASLGAGLTEDEDQTIIAALAELVRRVEAAEKERDGALNGWAKGQIRFEAAEARVTELEAALRTLLSGCDAIIPALDAAEVVTERDRAKFLNAYNESSLAAGTE